MQTRAIMDCLSKIVSVEKALYETRMMQYTLRVYKACYEQMKRESYVRINAVWSNLEKLMKSTDEQIVASACRFEYIDPEDSNWPTDEFEDDSDDDYEDDSDDDYDIYSCYTAARDEYTTQFRASASMHFERPVLPKQPQVITHHIEQPGKKPEPFDFSVSIPFTTMIFATVFFCLIAVTALLMDKYPSTPSMLIPSIILGIIASFIFNHFRCKTKYKKASEEYSQQVETYNKLRAEELDSLSAEQEWYKNARTAYEQALATTIRRAQEECGADAALRISCFDAEINRLDATIADLKKTLQGLYAKDIIYKKYQTWPACATMLEYLQSGRCNQLEGSHGAYNLYESELRQDLILHELSEIRAKLDEIKKTMYTMYHAIQQTNRHLNELNNQVQNIVKLSAAQLQAQIQTNSLLAVNNACAAAIAANTEATKYLMLVQ